MKIFHVVRTVYSNFYVQALDEDDALETVQHNIDDFDSGSTTVVNEDWDVELDDDEEEENEDEEDSEVEGDNEDLDVDAMLSQIRMRVRAMTGELK